MTLSSLSFLYYFIPAFITLYFVAPIIVRGKNLLCRNIVLLLGGIVFYLWARPIHIALMTFQTASAYLFGVLILRCKTKGASKTALIIGIVVSFSALIILKYADFAIESVNTLVGSTVKAFNFALPLGISFVSFKAVSYLIDAYRNKENAEKNFFTVASYLVFFPQVSSGPIGRFGAFREDFKTRALDTGRIASGVRRFIIGLAKKVIIAGAMTELRGDLAGANTVLSAWLCAIAYTFEIYYDFSGYTDMAIGIGSILGFKSPENFDYPYTAKSVTDFWRRWHISLTTWFRDYMCSA